jgi:hypothetical protein
MGRLVDQLNQGRFASAAFGAAMVAAAALYLALMQGASFFADEWFWVYNRLDPSVDTVLEPFNGSLNAVPLLIYQGVVGLFGLDHYAPFRVLTIAFDLLCSLLLFVYLRRRINPWLAFVPAALLLIFGSGWWDLITSFSLLWTSAISASLGALLALDREDRAGDLAACLLLILSVASHSPGLAFAAGAAVTTILGSRPWRPRAWIWAIPIGLYAVWAVWAESEYHAGPVELSQVAAVPGTIFVALSSAIAGIAGLYRVPEAGELVFAPELAYPAAFAAIVTVAALAVLGRLPRQAWVGIVMALAYWASIALVASSSRQPTDNRYLYLGALLVFLTTAALVTARPPFAARVWVAVGVAFLVSAVPNLKALVDGASAVERNSRATRAVLATIELTREQVDPRFAPSAVIPGGDDVYLPASAGAYLELIDDKGSPAYTLEELTTADQEQRGLADQNLIGALAVGLERTRPPSATGPGRPPCQRRQPGPNGELTVETGSEVVIDLASGPPASVKLGRFSDRPSLPIGMVTGGGSARVTLPQDRIPGPWAIALQPSARAAFCVAG